MVYKKKNFYALKIISIVLMLFNVSHGAISKNFLNNLKKLELEISSHKSLDECFAPHQKSYMSYKEYYLRCLYAICSQIMYKYIIYKAHEENQQILKIYKYMEQYAMNPCTTPTTKQYSIFHEFIEPATEVAINAFSQKIEAEIKIIALISSYNDFDTNNRSLDYCKPMIEKANQAYLDTLVEHIKRIEQIIHKLNQPKEACIEKTSTTTPLVIEKIENSPPVKNKESRQELILVEDYCQANN